MTSASCVVIYFRDHFYQYGELRSITVASKQQCAFVQFVSRGSAELAAEKSFNKLILKGRRLNVKWGKSHGASGATVVREESVKSLEPVPGLPHGMKHCDFYFAISIRFSN